MTSAGGFRPTTCPARWNPWLRWLSPESSGHAMKFTRITVDPAVSTGKACIRDLRFPVSRLLGLLAARQTPAARRASPHSGPFHTENPKACDARRLQQLVYGVDVILHQSSPCVALSHPSTPSEHGHGTATVASTIVVGVMLDDDVRTRLLDA